MPVYRRQLGRRSWQGLIAAALLVIALSRVEVWGAWWSFVGFHDLGNAQQLAMRRCEDPGWYGLIKVLSQDTTPPCGLGWFVRHSAKRLNPMRASWLRRVAEDISETPLARLRAGLTVVVGGAAPPDDFAWVVQDPALDGSLRDSVDELLSYDVSELDWADPGVWERIGARRFLDGESAAAGRLSDALRIRASTGFLASHGGDQFPELTLAAVHRAITAPGEDGSGLSVWRANVVRDCQTTDTPECLRALADWADAVGRWEDRDNLEESRDRGVPPNSLATSLWLATYPDDEQRVDALGWRFAETAEWIRKVPDDEQRAHRLLSVIARPSHRFGVEPARLGATGDPFFAIALGRSSPWTTALGAMALAELAGIEVKVEGVGDGVVIRVAGLAVGVLPCGEALDVLPPESPSWPPQAVLGQAALEGAGAALRQSAYRRAMRLATLADRTDPVGAAGALDVVVQLSSLPGHNAWKAGAALGKQVARVQATAREGADAERSQRAALWPNALSEWNTPGSGGCPSTLGN